MEFQCRVIVQRRCTSCCSSVENIPLQAERPSARRQKLFAFPPESAFTFRPECCSASQRNLVHLRPDSPKCTTFAAELPFQPQTTSICLTAEWNRIFAAGWEARVPERLLTAYTGGPGDSPATAVSIQAPDLATAIHGEYW